MTHLIERFTEILKKGKYNTATISAYRNAIFVFYNHFRDYPQSQITDELISTYLLSLQNSKHSIQDAIQAGKAIKLFYEVIFNKTINVKSTGKIKSDQKIDVFTHDEVKLLLSTIKNPKHKLLLILVYNSGLKINEVINLEVSDLDTVNHTILLKHKNPKKNRLLRLSPNIISFVTKYLDKYKPSSILFPGAGGEGYYSARNIQLFFQKVINDSGIDKQATLNTLRHSFAVHSLENGLDIHILKDILGHSNIQTTTAYTQLIKIKLENIRNPIEDIKISVSL